MLLPNVPLQLTDKIPQGPESLVRKNKAEFEDFFSVAIRIAGRKAIENIQTSYADLWASERAPDMLKHLSGKVVVDLGCGVGPNFRGQLAKEKPASYIGVDQLMGYGYRPFEDTDIGIVIPLSVEAGDKVEGALIRADMLDVVSRLPDSSSSFVINGIDDLILDSKTEYAKELVRQIDRVTSADGFIIGATGCGGVLEAFSDMDRYDTQKVTLWGIDFVSHHKLDVHSTPLT